MLGLAGNVFRTKWNVSNLVHSKSSFSTEVHASPGFKLPDLPYGYGELQPAITGEIMEVHHKKHHQAYVNNLNIALEKYVIAEKNANLDEMIALQSAIRFNGGGHINHSIFWTNLAPRKAGGGGEPLGALATKLQQQYGSFATFQTKFNTTTAAIQGSGWGWLAYNKAEDKLVITTCANQDPVSSQGLVPLLGIDVWEHAYYLQYKNLRPDYLKAIWEIVNWKNVAERFEAAKKA